MPILHPPPPWIGSPFSRYVELWHGCLKSDVKSIRKGIDPTKGNPVSDFGRGFYTSTVKRQAREWAWKRWADSKGKLRGTGGAPLVVRFRIPLEQLAVLDSLVFVVGNHEQDRFWSFVHHCRQSTTRIVRAHGHPAHKAPDDWYDVVWGPVAAFWTQRVLMDSADQVSFHTTRGAAVLNNAMHGPDGESFRIFRVRAGRQR